MTALIFIGIAALAAYVIFCLVSDHRERRKIEARHWAEQAARRQL